MTYLSQKPVPTFEFQGIAYKRVSPALSLKKIGLSDSFVNQEIHLSNKIRVTNRERTLVNSIHRVDLSGGLEAVIHAIQACPSIDTKMICKYILSLKLPTLYGKVGFLIEKFGTGPGVKSELLEPLRKRLPQYIPYFDRSQKHERLHSRWHIILKKRRIGVE